MRSTCLIAVAAVSLATGCMPMEKFSHQATEYNIQTADAQDQTLLLNILRAANRLPMHFTELTTLSGTATMTVGGTVTVPVGILNGGMNTGSVAPTASIAETPTFNAAVLETQEFYQGMLKPVSVTQAATYIDEGLQPELVFTLLFGSIQYQALPNAAASLIENNFHPIKCENLPPSPEAPPDQWNGCPTTSPAPGANVPTVKSVGPCRDRTVSEYWCFREVLRALLERHLTTEPTEEKVNVGPLLNQASFNDPKWLSGLDPKTYKIASVDLKACINKADSCPEGLAALPPEQRNALARHELLFRIQKDSNDFRLCFDEDPGPEPVKNSARKSNATPPPPLPVREDAASRIKETKLPRELICKSRIPEPKTPDVPELPKPGATNAPTAYPELSPGAVLEAPSARQGSYGIRLPAPGQPDQFFSVQFQPRSTEGIIYFLGEISRCQLLLDRSQACSLNLMPTVRVTYRNPAGEEDRLFTVCTRECTENAPHTEHIEVGWSGERYLVPMDPTARDRSGQVLRVLTQLLALNRSAKDYPTPAVIPVISH
jgi:hypothetical protein